MRVPAVVIGSIVASLGLAGAAAADPAVAFHVVDVDGQRRVVIDTPIEVTARPPRPAVAVLAAPPRLDYVWPAEVDSFLARIVASVAQVRP